MDVHPGRRKLNSNTPTIVMKAGRPWIAVGAAGGHTIPQTVPLTVAQMIDYGKDMAQALASPRIAFVAESRTLSVEPRLAEAIRKSLEARGHAVRAVDIGRLHGLTVEWVRQAASFYRCARSARGGNRDQARADAETPRGSILSP
jgi:gamma-glutamyltranspeptidase / glutathione hydrolase